MEVRSVVRIMLCALFGLIELMVSVPMHGEENTAAKEDLAPLAIKLPKPIFLGTPKDIWTPNLEPQTGMQRAPFMAHKGAVNLSLNKPVTVSDKNPRIGESELITDGDKEGADGSFVEFGPGVQWVQIDLGQRCEVYAVVIWHYYLEGRVYFDVVVNSAEDPDFIMGVKTLFNNDHDNSSGLGVGKDKEYIEVYEGKLIDTKRTETRYIRLYSNGSTSGGLNHYIEVEVWGKPLGK